MTSFSLKPIYPLYLANEAVQPNTDLVVTDKFTGQPATRVALANAALIDIDGESPGHIPATYEMVAKALKVRC